MRYVAFALSLLMVAAAPASAQRSPYGVWFAYGEKNDIVAMTVKGRVGLAIFCKTGDLSLGVIEPEKSKLRLQPGESMTVRFRADHAPEMTSSATARNARSLAFADGRALIRQIVNARHVSFEFARADGSRFTRAYSVDGARAVMEEIGKGCPL